MYLKKKFNKVNGSALANLTKASLAVQLIKHLHGNAGDARDVGLISRRR